MNLEFRFCNVLCILFQVFFWFLFFWLFFETFVVKCWIFLNKVISWIWNVKSGRFLLQTAVTNVVIISITQFVSRGFLIFKRGLACNLTVKFSFRNRLNCRALWIKSIIRFGPVSTTFYPQKWKQKKLHMQSCLSDAANSSLEFSDRFVACSRSFN